MSAVSTWSTTAANNNSAPPDGWPEGMAPSNVNDCAREMMAAVKTFYDEEQTFHGVPQNAQTGNYTLVLADAGKHIYHASGAGAGDTYTIPANASVAFAIGTVITFVNSDSNSVAIAITSDVLTLAGTTSTGNRTLAQNGVAVAIKVTSTLWIISGTGLT
jgi:hypothetical protein